MTRYAIARWLLDQGFVRVPRGQDGHQHFVRVGVKVTLQWHGSKDVTKTHVGLIRRQVRKAGLDMPARLP